MYRTQNLYNVSIILYVWKSISPSPLQYKIHPSQIIETHFSIFRHKPPAILDALHGFPPSPNRAKRAIWHALPNLFKEGLQNLVACAMIPPTAGKRQQGCRIFPADDIESIRFGGTTQGGQRYDEPFYSRFPHRPGRDDRHCAALQLCADGAASGNPVRGLCRLNG